VTETPGDAGHKVQAHVLADEISLRACAFSALPRSLTSALSKETKPAARSASAALRSAVNYSTDYSLRSIMNRSTRTQADDPIKYGGHHLRDYFRFPLNPKSEAGADEMAQDAKSDGRS